MTGIGGAPTYNVHVHGGGRKHTQLYQEYIIEEEREYRTVLTVYRVETHNAKSHDHPHVCAI